MGIIDNLRFAHDSARAAAGSFNRRYKVYLGTVLKASYDPGLSNPATKVVTSYTELGHTNRITGFIVPFEVNEVDSSVIFNNGSDYEIIEIKYITKSYNTGLYTGGYTTAQLQVPSECLDLQTFYKLVNIDTNAPHYYKLIRVHDYNRIYIDLQLQKIADIE
jgi:hypothetical protein